MTSFEAQYYEAESFWAEGAISDAHNIQRFESTCSLIPNDVQSILDVGCGNGEFLRVIRRIRPNAALQGLDRSKAALKYVDAEAFQGNVDSIPLPDNCADCVTCLQVIEHLPCDIYPNALRELARCAQRYLIVGVPYAEDLRTEIAQCPQCYCVFNLNLHVRSFDLPTLNKLFDAHGYDLTSHLFPCPVTKYWGADALTHYRNRTIDRRRTDFISPVCPLCGYSEGDVTKISASKVNETKPGPLSRAYTRVLNGVMRRVWPTVQKEGYWVVALYTKRTNS